METKKFGWFQCLDGTMLKIIAMVTMFLDHAGKTLFLDQDWMVCVGRLAFPIFAFQIAEGYRHTKNFKMYWKRMLIYALIAEIPFNIMCGGLIYPTGQNVLFTFCLALLIIRLIDIAWQKHKLLGLAAALVSITVGYFAAFLLCTDYMGYGILMVVSFWIFSHIKFGWILQCMMMIYVNWFMIGGWNLTFMFWEKEIWIPVQGFAILAMIPILMYNGKRGFAGKTFQHAVYIFYPAHMLILGILMFLFQHIGA